MTEIVRDGICCIDGAGFVTGAEFEIVAICHELKTR